MQRTNNIRARIGIIILSLFAFLRLSGQDTNSYFGGEGLSFKDRIAIRTNIVDWVLTSPNIAFDYDIVNTPYRKNSIGLSFKYNWNTYHNYIPQRVYNLLDARIDYRFYWRQQPYDNRDNYYGDWEREWINSSKGLDKLRARLNCFRSVDNPKPHISIFAGPYVSVSNFSIKLNAADNALGRQGMVFGAGITGGIALPLYSYKNGAALDLELGGSIGLHLASYRFYKADVENNEYQPSSNRKGKSHKYVFAPLPSDIRVALVYRFRSISKQHTEIDYALIDRRYMTRLMDIDRAHATAYNDSISLLKDVLDKRNEEIALYKQTVENEPGFISAYSLEYLTPYVYMMEAPQKYTRYNKDTLPKVHIDDIKQITDPILLSVRKDIDSIPHVTSAQIDKEFVNQYNNISDADGKEVNRTTLIREIYTRLNSYIEENNSKLIAGTFSSDVYSEKLNKYNVKQQGRTLVEITYKDSVRTVEMTSNEKVEWLNSIKKQAWTDAQKRMRGEYPGHIEPSVMTLDSTLLDTVQVDSIRMDSLKTDSTRLDSIATDSLLENRMTTDSVKADNILAINMLSLEMTPTGYTVTTLENAVDAKWYALRRRDYFITEEDED